MSAPLIWVVIPVILAAGLWFLRRRENLVAGLAAGACLLLALLAWLLPLGTVMRLGPLALRVDTILLVFGRKFELAMIDRPYLILLYLMGAVWFLGSRVARVRASFVPIGLAMIALVVAAQAVEPFLFAALILEMAILISLPLLTSSGRQTSQGALRYLVFQTLAVPFILMAGWAAGQVELNPPGARWVVQAVLFMMFGFAFWLAVFPFNTWVPLLTEAISPYTVGFLLGLVPVGVLWIILGFLDGYAWLRDNNLVITGLRLTGMLMILTSGIWVAFQDDLGRVLGYAILLENGYALLALGLHSQLGLELFAAGLMPRLVAIALWALSLSVLQKNGEITTLVGLKGALRRYPVVSAGLALAYFSIGGMPLLPSFPIRQALIESLASQSWPTAAGAALGNMGFLIGGLRLLAALVDSEEKEWKFNDRLLEAVMILAAMAALVAVGLLPGVFLRGSLGLVQAFTHLR